MQTRHLVLPLILVIILNVFAPQPNAASAVFSDHGLLHTASSTLAISSSQANQEQSTLNEQPNNGMPNWPEPSKPIPRHQPGYLAKTLSLGQALNGIQVSGAQGYDLEDVLAENAMTDPFQANYTFVDHAQIMLGWAESADGAQILYTETSRASADTDLDDVYELTPPLPIENSQSQTSPAPLNSAFALAAGDVNGDGQYEQITAWIDPAKDNQITVSVGQMPGTEGKVQGLPATLQSSQGIEIFARGNDDALWHKVDNETSRWEPLGGVLASSPTAVSLNATTQLFALGADKQIYTMQRTGTDWTNWQPIESPSGITFQSAPGAVVNNGKIIIFARATNNTIWHCEYTETSCIWQSLGGFATSAPQVVRYDNDRLALFIRGFDNGLWYTLSNNGQWTQWQPLELADALTLTTDPAPVSSGNGKIELFVHASDQSIRRNEYNGGSWSGWTTLLNPTAVTHIHATIDSSGKTLFYTHQLSGLLKHWENTSNGWVGELLEGLPVCCTTIETGIIPSNLTTKVIVDTGYFLGNGRDQIVVSGINANGNAEVQVHDIGVGFRPQQTSKFVISDTLNVNPIFHMAIGNLWQEASAPQIYQDEMVIAYSRPADFVVQIWALEDDGLFVKSVEHSFGSLEHFRGVYPRPDPEPCPFGIDDGPLDLISVNKYDVQVSVGNPLQGSLDSIIVGFSAALQFKKRFDCGIVEEETRNAVFLFGLNVEATSNSLTPGKILWVDTPNVSNPLFAVTVGDITGPISGLERVDEVISIYSDGSIRIYSVASDISLTEVTSIQGLSLEGSVEIETGDLNRDLQDEIVLLTGGSIPKIKAYQYKDNQIQLIGDHQPNPLPTANTQMALALGNFNGESLRVGTPTHRVERDVVDVIAIINRPPTHRDHLDSCPNGECDVYSRDQDVFASFAETNEESSDLQIGIKRSWSTSKEGGVKIADILKSSIVATYGERFEKVTEEIQEVKLTKEVRASLDDMGIYTVADYDIWEYPLYSNSIERPVSHIVVIFPKQSQSPGGVDVYSQEIALPGYSCESWYHAIHSPYNIWSYPNNADQLTQYATERLIIESPFSTDQSQSIDLAWKDVDVSKLTSSRYRAFKSSVGVDLKVWNTEVRGEYSEESVSTLTIKGSQSTSIKINQKAIDQQVQDYGYYKYNAYIYWSEDGYLVLDYTTDLPPETSLAKKYDREDPAFLFPWPAGNNNCPTTIAGSEFSRDIVIEPASIKAGETVTISAFVHNLSGKPATNVDIWFYLDDPNNSEPIGKAVIPEISKSTGRVNVSIQWMAVGHGDKRIYAIIDPEKKINEMHDETTGINNNKAYGVMSIKSVGYADPGMIEEHEYYELSLYSNNKPVQTDSLDARAYIPLSALSNEVRQFELTLALTWPSLPVGKGLVGAPVTLIAASSDASSDFFDFNPSLQGPPGILTLRYSEEATSLIEGSETDMAIYMLKDNSWKLLKCNDAAASHVPETNMFVAQICGTGTFAILGPKSSSPTPNGIYLPLIHK